MTTLIDAKKITGESRIVLSKKICGKLSVNAGDIVHFIEDDAGRIYLQKAEVKS